MDSSLDPGSLGQTRKEPSYVRGVDARSEVVALADGAEEGLPAVQAKTAPPLHPLLDDRLGRRIDGHDPRFVSLAMLDGHGAVLQIQIRGLEGQGL